MTGLNPEDSVIKAITDLEAESIDALVNASLNREITDNYCAPWHDQDGTLECPVCEDEWHGLPNDRCPGAFATPAQKGAYTKGHRPGGAKRRMEREYREHVLRLRQGVVRRATARDEQRQAISRAFDVPEEMLTVEIEGPATVTIRSDRVTLHGVPTPRGILALEAVLVRLREQYSQDS